MRYLAYLANPDKTMCHIIFHVTPSLYRIIENEKKKIKLEK